MRKPKSYSDRRKRAEKAKKPIYGVGINDIDEYLKGTKMYVVWKSMFARCYDKKFQAANPSYIGCQVDERWHKLSDFKQWFEKNYREGYSLDKDILNSDNKIYGPDTCLFVPDYINRVFKTFTFRGKKFSGVNRQCNAYYAEFRENGRRHKLKFSNKADATEAYWKMKKEYCLSVVEKYYHDKLINERIYNALIKKISCAI